MERETIIVLDFGGQYKQLIARRVRECGVYCEIHPHTLGIEAIREMGPRGIILTGGPASVYDSKSPTCPPELFELGIPVLGICYGSQLMAYRCGAGAGPVSPSAFPDETFPREKGKTAAAGGSAVLSAGKESSPAANEGAVQTAPVSEYGRTRVFMDVADSALFRDVEAVSNVGHSGAQAGALPERALPENDFPERALPENDFPEYAPPESDLPECAPPENDFPECVPPESDLPARVRAGKGEDVGRLPSTICWMSHTDYIARLPEGFCATAHTAHCPVAAMENATKKLYAVQFHPEVEHTPEGRKMLRNFVLGICACKGDWEMSSFAIRMVRELRDKIGDDHVLLGLSGGVDSTVTAALLSRAIGDQLHCVFVDHGLMRKDEGDEVERLFGPGSDFHLHFTRVNARDRFFRRLMGQTNPETKRTIIGDEFPRVFGEEAAKLKGKVRYLAQGTIYPDVVESGDGKTGDVIKSHHNVGGLPLELVRELGFDETPIEPLRMLFKDEVRRVGLELGIPHALVFRQPFPGPGLAVRIIGEISPDKVQVVQEADAIFREELHRAGVDESLGQYFAALSNMHSVGVMGDHRTYGLAVILRAVLTSDYMTAEAAEIPWPVLQKTMNRIIGEVEGVNRVLYDITSKPPGTIEFE